MVPWGQGHCADVPSLLLLPMLGKTYKGRARSPACLRLGGDADGGPVGGHGRCAALCCLLLAQRAYQAPDVGGQGAAALQQLTCGRAAGDEVMDEILYVYMLPLVLSSWGRACMESDGHA